MDDVVKNLGDIGIIPVVVIDDADTAVPLSQALIEGGLPCAEITFRTAAAADAIKKMSGTFPDILVGAGTVLSIEHAELAAASGAQFIVTPGFDANVVGWCLANDMPIFPGVMTPTDINQAIAQGLTILKFFPAETAGGVEALRAIGNPYVDLKFIPTGGININNLADYLALPMVHACGGSFMVKRELIVEGRFDEIMELAKTAVHIVKSVRG